MVESRGLSYSCAEENYPIEEVALREAPVSPKKVSFLKRFFIHRDDALIKMTAAIPLDHSFPGNHFNLR